MAKVFALAAEDIKQLAPGHGSCLASDRITVDGDKVGYMYREPPDHAGDSGWRFCEGTEDVDYLAEPDNMAVFDVNTIANYDPAIIPYLGASAGSAFARSGEAFAPEPLLVEED